MDLTRSFGARLPYNQRAPEDEAVKSRPSVWE